MIQHLRNEAHRFGITFHRQKRSKNAWSSALDEIPGVGPKTATQLIRKFKSFKRIREATEAELQQILGPNKGKILFQELQKLG